MVDFKGKLVLAPMVRAGELPTRLLALRYGADLVWSPEIIDRKILTCKRIENEKLGTVDYLSEGKTKIPGVTNLVFRTDRDFEHGKLIFQMGTSNSEIAVKAANLIIGDVDGIDINAGCPKHFSIHAGMGAALLKTPDLLVDILEKLVENVGKPNNKPISVKIRLFPEEEESLKLISRLVQTGITNLTVHCRTQNMRNRETPIRYYFHKIKKICDGHGVSLIINGALENREDFEKLKQKWVESSEFNEIVETSKDEVDEETFLKKRYQRSMKLGE
jgi:tRNA-dihydrouridine synthase 2